MKYILIDGSNIEYRNFNILNHNGGNTMLTSKGINVSNVNAVLWSVHKVCKLLEGDKIFVCFDKTISDKSNFRKDLLDGEYKAKRKKPDNIQELYDQELIITKILKTMGIQVLFPYRMECDDIISWLCDTLVGDKVIVSNDGDFNQLIRNDVEIYNPGKKCIIDVANFEDKVGVKLQYFKKYKAIMGDASDNIVGLRGYGKVRAKKMSETWDDANISDEYKEIVERNLRIIDLHTGYGEYPEEVSSYETQLFDQSHVRYAGKIFKKICNRYELHSIVNRIYEWRPVFNVPKEENELAKALGFC